MTLIALNCQIKKKKKPAFIQQVCCVLFRLEPGEKSWGLLGEGRLRCNLSSTGKWTCIFQKHRPLGPTAVELRVQVLALKLPVDGL